MILARRARFKNLMVKAFNLIPEFIRNPKLVILGARGVHLYTYLSLRRTWLQTAAISTVIDVGANTGQFASAIHELLPNARIYSFEPIPHCHQELRRRFQHLDNFRSFEVALGETTSRATFQQSDFAESSSLLSMTTLHQKSFPWTAKSTPIEVEVRPLDSFAPQLQLTNPLLVKVDVQGFEDRVLRGGEQILRAADFVFVETSFAPLYEGQGSFETIYDILLTYGFRFAGIMDQMLDPRDDRPLQADALFVRKHQS